MSYIQIILITLLAAAKAYDYHTTQVFIFNSVFWGALAGLIMGDVMTGLYIGGTLQLMSLGVVAIGGSSAPDYPLATIIATTIAISTGEGIEIGLTAGIAVGMLLVQLDIIAKLINGHIGRKMQEYCNKGQFDKMNKSVWLSVILMMLNSALPTFIAVTLGSAVVSLIVDSFPAWLTIGLTVAGGLLPAVGLAMLLTYMPTAKYVSYLLIGFVFNAYLGVPVLGIAFIGVACAILFYNQKISQIHSPEMAISGGLEDE